MAEDKAKQVRKVKQLLALAEHPDTSDAEREAAFARVGLLMLKYEIADADLDTGTGEVSERIVLYEHAVSGRGGHGKERAWALGDVAEGMGCEVAFRGNDVGNRIRWVLIVGPEPTIDNLKILLPSVLLQMENAAGRSARERVRALPSWLSPAEKTAESARARRSFMRGFGVGIKDRLQAARAEYADELSGDAATGDTLAKSRELVLVNREQLVHAEFQRRFPKLGKARGRRRLDEHAYRRGRAAGRSADLGDSQLGRPRRDELN
ncbi:DUF2786 domain-containing protein [Actinomadura rupiterrae]|uniref:DUF2786 domain-containing protein n=1 Tax=Actinomadura rupiterrae TaxID=559627 RepID=UPI0020A55C79|nr:DUF2786 domain-containing protein [Actinomadura rupiterrae]MCP2337500.1 hypothetical protein [Actinomadura rupiterrae]